VDEDSPVASAPPPLVAAAGITLLEGILTVLFGISELISLDADRLAMGISTALFFVAYGVALLFCSWGLRWLRGWARGPVLLSQLIWLGLAWNFRDGNTLPIAIFLAVLAAIALAGMLHPRSVDALERASGHR
jgi:hypothetical protein